MILLMEDLNYPSWPLSQIQWNMGTPTTQLQTQAIPLDGSVRGLLFGNRFVWWTFTRETEHALRDRWCLPWAKWKLLESPCLFKVQGPDVQTKTILKKKKSLSVPRKAFSEGPEHGHCGECSLCNPCPNSDVSIGEDEDVVETRRFMCTFRNLNRNSW